MARVLNTLRTHWKKSVLFSAALVYGANVANRKVHENRVMKHMCAEALKYGSVPHPLSEHTYAVTVILNPAADKGRARAKFDKYCAPILHLAGIKVSVVRTEGEGQAKGLMEVMGEEGADAVLVAGGDGTLMEAVTGLLRRPDAEVRRRRPIGILPLGANNRLAKRIFHLDESSSRAGDVALMASAAMACVKQVYRPMDVMQVENLSDDEEFRGKKLFALNELQIGAFRDAHDRMGRYWYWAGLKKLMAYVFAYTSSAKEMLWHISADLDYAMSSGADALALAQAPPAPTWSWWDYIVPRAKVVEEKKAETELFDWNSVADFNGLEIRVRTPGVSLPDEDKNLELVLGPNALTFSEFASEGWARETGQGEVGVASDDGKWTWLNAQAVRLKPGKQLEDAGKYFSLDDESVELKGPVQITLLPNKVVMFCSEDLQKEVRRSEEPSKGDKKWWQSRGKAISTSHLSSAKRF